MPPILLLLFLCIVLSLVAVGAARFAASQPTDSYISEVRLAVVQGVYHIGFLKRADIYDKAIASLVDEVTTNAAKPSHAA